MSSKPKIKGNAWERDVAKHLSSIFNENFMRVPNSGAYTGGANIHRCDKLTESQKRMMSGDIIVPQSLSNWKIECKNYKDLEFHRLLTQCKLIDKWLKQVCTEDYKNDLLWLLVVKISRKCKFVAFSQLIVDNFEIPNYNKVYYKPEFMDPIIITNYDGFFEKNYRSLIKLNEYSHDTSLPI